MISNNIKLKCALLLISGGLLTANVAIADKPDWAGSGKGNSNHSDRRDNQRDERRDDNRQGDRDGSQRSHFEQRHTVIVHDYYAEQLQGRRCPPGLAKKHNGCMPPGQARKWEVGHRLPPDVVYYSVPQPLVTQIGPPPSGYRYIRVAGDILMIAIGSGMVVDAIKDLGRS